LGLLGVVGLSTSAFDKAKQRIAIMMARKKNKKRRSCSSSSSSSSSASSILLARQNMGACLFLSLQLLLLTSTYTTNNDYVNNNNINNYCCPNDHDHYNTTATATATATATSSVTGNALFFSSNVTIGTVLRLLPCAVRAISISIPTINIPIGFPILSIANAATVVQCRSDRCIPGCDCKKADLTVCAEDYGDWGWKPPGDAVDESVYDKMPPQVSTTVKRQETKRNKSNQDTL